MEWAERLTEPQNKLDELWLVANFSLYVFEKDSVIVQPSAAVWLNTAHHVY